MLKNKNITLYVSGSIAAYKALIITRQLIKAQANVRVVMTESAQKFVTPLSFQTLSKNVVYIDAFESVNPSGVDHVELADWTDLAIIAPASANIIGKMAQGIADDMASLTLMATNSPKLIAPAMNNHMWQSPAVKRNVKILRNDGVNFIDPDTGFLAEGYEGKGRMAEPEQIVATVDSLLSESTNFLGKKVLITAGGTRERIDPVRYIGNDSSGKMGYAIAEVMQQNGADVTLISGITTIKAPMGVKLISVTSAVELYNEVLSNFSINDILIMSAAVADFKPSRVAEHKIKKQRVSLEIELTKTPDILEAVAKIKRPGQLTVGFAAETQNLIDNATEKFNRKNLDLMVANDVSKPGVGFNGDTNQVTFITADGLEPTSKLTKKEIAYLIMKKIEKLC